MLNLVDIEKGLYATEARKRRHTFIFVVATLLSLTLVLVLMLTSKDKYVLELIFTILVSITYLIYLTFYFTVIRRFFKNELRFYEGVKNSELSELYCEILSISEEEKEYNGRSYYILDARVNENLKDEDKIFYLPKKFQFKKNQKAKLQVFGSIVINVEFRK